MVLNSIRCCVTAFFKDGSLFFDNQCHHLIPGPVFLNEKNEYFLDQNLNYQLTILVIPSSSTEATMEEMEEVMANEPLLEQQSAPPQATIPQTAQQSAPKQATKQRTPPQPVQQSAPIQATKQQTPPQPAQQSAPIQATKQQTPPRPAQRSAPTQATTQQTPQSQSPNEQPINNNFEDHDEIMERKHTDWTIDETKFLIATMRPYIELNDELPSTLSELEKRIKLGKGNKKNMWKEICEAMTFKFYLQFDPKRISRKWQTLIDGYKKAIDNNSKTGQAPSKFQWFDEMDQLLGGRHDIHPVVTATQNGVIIHRPKDIGPKDGGQTSEIDYDSESTPSLDSNWTTPTAVGTQKGSKLKSLKRKRAESETNVDKLLEYMKEMDKKSMETDEKILDELSNGLPQVAYLKGSHFLCFHKGDPSMFSYCLRPNYFLPKGPRPSIPSKYAIEPPVSLPRSPSAPMPYQASEPTYAFKPHIFLSHTTPQPSPGCAKIPSLHRPVACGGPGGPAPPCVLPGPPAFCLRRAFVHACPPHGSGGPLLQNCHATGLSLHSFSPIPTILFGTYQCKSRFESHWAALLFEDNAKAIQQKYYFNIITNSLLNLICKSFEFQTSNYI